MPAFERAELTAEFKVRTSGTGGSQDHIEAAKTAAGESGLAREAGPETVVLAGERREVLGALVETVEAALEAGAPGIEVRIEAEPDAERFGRT